MVTTYIEYTALYVPIIGKINSAEILSRGLKGNTALWLSGISQDCRRIVNAPYPNVRHSKYY